MIGGLIKSETAWVLSRTSTFDANKAEELKNILKAQGVNTDGQTLTNGQIYYRESSSSSDLNKHFIVKEYMLLSLKKNILHFSNFFKLI